jgi:peptidoglycan/LPS O-acetylase OafA/YrhL
MGSARKNNFNLLRIIGAGAVLVSHAFPISSGQGAREPLAATLGVSLGTLGVITFFAISGYFISSSFHNRRSALEFVVARALRIYPGLLLVLALTVLLLGPAFTKLPFSTYLLDTHTLLYIPKNLALWPLQYDLPGVFTLNAYPEAINGSLWTLVYEVACYSIVAIIGISGLSSNGWRFAVFLLAYGAWYILTIPLLRGSSPHLTMIRNFHELTLPFIIGMTLFQLRGRVGFRLPILVLLAFAGVVSYGRVWFAEIFILAWSYGVFYFGFLRWAPLLAYNRTGDYSYGMYIYAFPVEQAISSIYNGSSPAVIIILSMPITLLLAVLSWHCVEERALNHKSIVAHWLTRQGRRMQLLGSRLAMVSDVSGRQQAVETTQRSVSSLEDAQRANRVADLREHPPPLI